MKAQLLFRDRRSHTQTFSIKAAESILGRDAGIAVPVSRDGVSRHHARILKEGEEYVIEDLRSTNGTFLNGQAVARDSLRHLDVIGLGKEAELIFVLRPDEAKTIRKVVVLDASLLRDTPGATPEALPVGEVTVGRSSACNIVATQGPVSKIHCRIVRTQKQVTLEDLGSSNGTFVNGERVMSAVLHEGDTLTLGAVEVFKVKVELGEVTAASGVHDAPATMMPPRPTEARRFSAEWKTRYEWDPSELAELAALQKKLHEEEAARQAPAAPQARGKGRAPGKAEERPPAKPAATAAKPATKPATKPAPSAPAPKAPASAKPALAATPAQPAATPPPAKPVERPKAPPVAPPPAAVVPPAVPAASPKAAVGAPSSGRIVELSLRGKEVDVAATETGAHELGRDKGAPLRVNHPTVSRQHARIIISDDRGVAYVQDRGGANGTRLNGAPIKEIKLLNDGDTVSIGDVDLVVSIRRE